MRGPDIWLLTDDVVGDVDGCLLGVLSNDDTPGNWSARIEGNCERSRGSHTLWIVTSADVRSRYDQ